MNAVDQVVFFLTVILIGGIVYYLWQQPEFRSTTQTNETEIPSPAHRGKRIFQREGCNACHSVTGTSDVGPPLNDLYGAERKLNDGAKIVADGEYIRESIWQPGRKVVQGYPNNMPSYRKLSEEQIHSLIQYLKFLSGDTENGTNRGTD